MIIIVYAALFVLLLYSMIFKYLLALLFLG